MKVTLFKDQEFVDFSWEDDDQAEAVHIYRFLSGPDRPTLPSTTMHRAFARSYWEKLIRAGFKLYL